MLLFCVSREKDSENPHLLVIAGSDKRGTIYGLFHLSEQMGVSPFVDWCGIKPCHRDKIIFAWDMECVSKEPSVEYRGFLSMMSGLRSETGVCIILAVLVQICMSIFLSCFFV